ncbi:holo-ACP synthase [Texcoconibacillus texcoconensis]|uniref:Holo-[acyl-carrier-protein] synthase n=1 Tax=Texcoconibacillus texcoconensis TaxID=1095777 RepID=A0A840QSB2_9BACI|nr:holo-ACP synthase [Texcoconibacillus texcoconensis]MBB5174219.1 holo-[acyl-carrier protein] synthase [Texcoconibacillus texcoconensis]
MIVGIGLDIVEIERIQKLTKRQPKFVFRILTEKELTSLDKLPEKKQMEYIAGRFAAKEACSKAIGCGIGASLSFQDIEVLRSESGKPLLEVKKQAYKNKSYHVSITHTSGHAAAQVIIEE